jgi:hypothetical protein
VIEHVPTARSVIVDPDTVQMLGEFDVYVTGWPLVDVAAGTGAAAPHTVLGNDGKLITSTPAPITTFTVCVVAAA